MKKFVNSLAALLLCCIVAVSLSVTAQAEELKIDSGRESSLTVILQDPDTDEPLTGITLSLYKVGDLGLIDSKIYVKADDAANSVTLNEILTEKRAAQLEAYVREKEYETVSKLITDGEGIVRFKNLEPGLYLVVQVSGSDEYVMNPFLVALPMQQGESLFYDYNVIAKPKLKREPQNPGDSGNPGDSDAPGNQEDVDNAIILQNPAGPQNPASPANPADGSKLPQTGQLWWPVLVMSALGLLCIVAGCWLKRSSRRSARRK